MSNQISINFRVAGGELSNYIDTLKKKNQELTNDAIKSALEQAKAGKEQLAVINQIIAANDRKNRMESQAIRSLALERREALLRENADNYAAQKAQVIKDVQAKKISFAEGGERIKMLDEKQKSEDITIKSEYKDSLNVFREQERQSKLQNQLSKEQIDTIKQTARENVAAITRGDKKLEEVISSANTDEERLIARLTEEQYNKEKRLQDKESGKGGSLLGSLLAVDNLNKVVSTVGQFTQTQNGFDLIQPASNLAGKMIGGILGGLVGSLVGGVGAFAGANVGSEVGGMFGDTFGALQMREALSKENFRKSALRYQSITGSNLDASTMPDMSGAGISFTQYMQMRSDYARRRGNAAYSDKTTRDANYLEKGLGIDQGTSAAIIELQRSSRESNRDLASLIGGILEKGNGSIFKNGDTTFLNEFVGRFASLQKELLKNSTTVSSGITMDILKQFNSVGGMFDARDPRSAGLINSIQGSLSNPSSDSARALSFGILRKQNPNAGIFDLREEMQKGLASPAYLKGTLDLINSMGGDDQAKMNNLSGRFEGVPLAAIRSIFNAYKGGKFSKYDTSELKAYGITDEILKGKAEANTTQLDKNAANIENGILSGKGIEKMAEAFKQAVEASLSGAVIELKNGQGTIRWNGAAPIQQNPTKTPLTSSGLIKANGGGVTAGIPGYLH